MTVGIVMLVHRDLYRAEQVARYWANAGCPVVLHVDKRVVRDGYDALAASLAGFADIRFCTRHACEWGKWSIVAATQTASDLMLAEFPHVGHVYLTSGACLPLRPAQNLVDHLARHPDVDFIESATTAEVPWAVGGLSDARFDLHFPFAWKQNRWLFDKYVQLQRALGVKRRMPQGLVPHLGSQWWCLTRRTLSAILCDPNRARYDRYFRRTWIPDESYFQTLVRAHSNRIESRSLTLSRFDCQGKPHVFYDDHADLLRRSDCFVARKVWPHADRLYARFLEGHAGDVGWDGKRTASDRVLSKSAEQRTRGREGLYMQSRWPRRARARCVTAAPYSVFQGFSDVFEGFETWLATRTGASVHGHLFAPDRVAFAGGEPETCGALTDSAQVRDYSPGDFLTSLIWNARSERQCFQFGPGDNQVIAQQIAEDRKAQISVIAGAWAVPLYQSGAAIKDLRGRAATLQKIEKAQLDQLRMVSDGARIRIWTMASVVEAPLVPLQDALDGMGKTAILQNADMPRVVDLSGFGRFLKALRNEGMHPDAMNFPMEPPRRYPLPVSPRARYVVR